MAPYMMVELRESDTAVVIGSQNISADSGQLARRALAMRLQDNHGNGRSCYVLEYMIDDHGSNVVDRYDLYHV
jgi:hypothetical protein